MFRIFFISLLLLFFSGCSGVNTDQQSNNTGANTSGDYSPIIPATTKVINEESLNLLAAISPDFSTYTFDGATSQLNSIQAGDILVIPPKAPMNPDGLLRKVESIKRDNGKTVITTVQAYLDEAIEQGEIHFDQVLTLQDVEEEENLHQAIEPLSSPKVQASKALSKAALLQMGFGLRDTVLPGVVVKGSFWMSLQPQLSIKISYFSLKELKAVMKANENAQLRVTASSSVKGEKEKKIKTIRFKPFTVWVSYVPVYIRPVLEIYLGSSISAQAKLASEVNQVLDYQAGVQYVNQQWALVNQLNKSFSFDPPSLDSTLSSQAYFRPQLNFRIYGVNAPYAAVKGYLQLDADINKEPFCDLYAGISGLAGVKGKVLGVNLGQIEKQVFDFKKMLYQCKTPYMVVSDTLDKIITAAEGNVSQQNAKSYLVAGKNGQINWTNSKNQSWLDLTATGGTVDESNKDILTLNINNQADQLKPGKYTAMVNFQNATNGKGDTKRLLTLDIREKKMQVEPGPDTYLLGADNEGNNFSNMATDFVIKSDIGSINYEVSSTADWLSISPASGTVDENTAQTITVAVNSNFAQQLSATTHAAKVVFTNTTNHTGDTSRKVFLQALMNVSSGDYSVTLPEGGPFGSVTKDWLISAVNDNIDWQASKNQSWLNLSATEGTATKGSSSTLTASLNESEAMKLKEGNYKAEIIIVNRNSGALIDQQKRYFNLQIKPPFTITPSSTAFSGPPGGSFSPAGQSMQISSDFNIDYSIRANANWLDISQNQGSLLAGQPQDITLSVNSNANQLAEGTYTATVTVSKSNGQPLSQTLPVTLTVSKSCNSGPVNFPALGTYGSYLEFGFNTQSGNCSIAQSTVDGDIIEWQLSESSQGVPSVYIIDAISQGMYFESVTPNTGYTSPYFNDRSLAWIPLAQDITITMVKKDAGGNITARYQGVFRVDVSPYRLSVQNFRRIE